LKTILVPLSPSEESRSILQYAFDFAEYFSAKIVILKSFEISTVTGPTPAIDKALKENCLKELKVILNNTHKKNCNFEISLVKGNLVENCEEYLQENEVDLIISTPKRSEKEPHLFVDDLTGKMIKNIECSLLLIPKNYVFKPYSTILMAIKSGVIKKEDVLTPLKEIHSKFKSSLHVLQVKTPKLKEKDLIINEALLQLKSSLTFTQNETIYHGVLEHLHEIKPDLICVIRRKRGFFSKLLSQDTIKKADFESRVPLLVLRGAL
jgi:nucleotide-binding universal stress UspA family protein